MDVLLDTRGRMRVKCLLLLYLFVVQAAANCPIPQGRKGIVLTDEALLMNDFPDGKKVPLECANGYVRESGSGIVTCVNGNWGEPDLICKMKDCGPPTPLPNASFNISAGTLFGAVIKVVCDKGYEISGSSYKQCYMAGWRGRAKCEIVTCDNPRPVTNGRHTWDSQDVPKYGEIVQYICNEGHTLVGNDSIMCSETGEYNSQPPECKGVTTEARITTTMVTPTPTPPVQGGKNILTTMIHFHVTEASTSTDSSATPTAHRENTITTTAAPAVSPTVQGGRDILSPENKATTTTVTSIPLSLSQDKHGGAVDTNKDIGYTPVVVSVICVLLVVCIVLFLHKFLLKRKGSYATREDLKPELLQFQNL